MICLVNLTILCYSRFNMTSKTTTYAFILGRERELCLAELKAVLARFGFCFSISSVTDNVARFNIDAEAESVGALINILGGTVKIFRIMTSSSVISTPRQGVEKSYKISPTPTESSGGRDDRQDKFESMKQRLEFKIHQFARRQLTWFRRFPEINWLSDYDEIKRFVRIFLEH